MTATTQDYSLKNRLLTEFELQKTGLLLDNPLLDNFRSGAAKAFSEAGFPNKKVEDYKYLRFDKLERADLSVPFTPDQVDLNQAIEKAIIPDEAIHIRIINGFPDLSNLNQELISEELEILSLGEAIRNNNKHVLSLLGTLVKPSSDAFAALNSAMFMGGVFIHVKKNHTANRPVFISEINDSSQGAFAQTRILFLAESNSEISVFHHQTNANCNSPAFANTVIEAELEKSARVTWTCIQEEGPSAMHILNTGVHIYAEAVLTHIMVSLSGGLIRNNTSMVMEEARAEGHLLGYYHPKGEETIDNHTVADHRKPHCNSNELYKGVIDGKGTAVFNGKIFVQKDAQKTNAFQSNKNILLSEGSTVNTKPQLEIYADDVKCSHGSSTGLFDADQIFYLRARGLSLKSARKLLLKAYADEVFERIPSEKVKEYLGRSIESLIEQE
jgi:Fe-S cluster assembly protein SufD